MPDVSSGRSASAKRNPRVAIFHLDDDAGSLLRDCFKQFTVDVVCTDDVGILERQKFEGCVAPLYSPEGLAVLPAVRGSAWHRRMVIYGLGDAIHLRQAGQFGISVLVDAPPSRTSATRAIRATRLLLLNEFRRYVRIPLATEIVLEQNARRAFGTTLEVSGGGMSVQCKDCNLRSDAALRITFRLPGRPELTMPASICWEDHSSHQLGIRFAADAEQRAMVKAWIDEYLELL